MNNIVGAIGTVIGTIMAILIIAIISWSVTACILKLIALCFGITITVGMITGIWLTLILIKTVFS